MQNKLLTEEMKKRFPAIGEQDGNGDDAVIYAHYWTSFSSFDWWVLEYDPEDGLFYGLVKSNLNYNTLEYGYFSLQEFEDARSRGLLYWIERDAHWSYITVGQLKNNLGKRGDLTE